jgi:hypothetical protein
MKIFANLMLWKDVIDGAQLGCAQEMIRATSDTHLRFARPPYSVNSWHQDASFTVNYMDGLFSNPTNLRLLDNLHGFTM